MAPRRGSFRRRGAGSSNMSSLIMQLMREQRAAEDSAIFDAYNNGGKFKGKDVTDDLLIKYMTDRRDGYDKQDALWDEWNNRLIQGKFSIGEQKVGLAFKQGKVGAGAVAAFYREQLKSIPKDSAFYRDVAGRAAQWVKSAAGAARGRARGRATAPLRDKLNAQLAAQQDYFGLEAALTAYARREGLISGSQSLTDADATDLQAMFDRGLYAGDTRITFDSFTKAAKDHYKALGGELQTRLALGQQGIEARRKRDKFLNETVVRLNAVDDRAAYEMARDAWLEARTAAGEDPYANAAADAAYAAALKGIHANAIKPIGSNVNEDEFVGGLVNEYDLLTTGKASGKTVADIYDMPGPDGDALGESFAAQQADIKNLTSGAAYLGQSEPGGPVHVVPWQTGFGKDPLGLDDSLQPSIQMVNGTKRVIYLKGQEVTGSVIKDDSGNVVNPATLTSDALRSGIRDGSLSIEEGGTVGFQFTTTTGEIKYGVTDPTTGKMVFTDENPWATGTLNLGGSLTVFGTSLIDRGGKDVPDLNTVYDPAKGIPGINTADPVLSDTPIAPKDLDALIKSGDLTLSDEEYQAYRTRVQLDEARRYGLPSARDDLAGRIGSTLGTPTDDSRKRFGVGQVTPNLTQNIQTLFGVRADHPNTDFGKPPTLSTRDQATINALRPPTSGALADETQKPSVSVTPKPPPKPPKVVVTPKKKAKPGRGAIKDSTPSPSTPATPITGHDSGGVWTP